MSSINDPILSVIVSSYNFKEYLIPCLESILSQKTQYSYEVIIIDDHSPDGSWELIQKYDTEHRSSDKIRIFQSSKNQGSARHAMFDTRPKVKSKYIALIDGDDLWYSADKIEKQIDFLEKNPDFIGASCSAILNYENKEEKNGKFWGMPDGAIWTIQDVFVQPHRCYTHKSANVWRNSFIQDDGFYLPDFMQDTGYLNDTTMSALFASADGKITSIPGIFSVYRFHGKGAWSSKTAEDMHNTHLREWFAMDAATRFKYHDLANVRVIDLIKNFEAQYGEKPDLIRPRILPQGIDKAPQYIGIDDNTAQLDALKQLISKNPDIWAQAGY